MFADFIMISRQCRCPGNFELEIEFSDHFDDGLAVFGKMKELELEGVLTKKKASIYRRGIRSNDWLRIQKQQKDKNL